MFDAYLQAAHIAKDPELSEQRATLYLDYEHIERFQAAEEVVRQDNVLAKRVANSPDRLEGEARNRSEYDRVKHNYLNMDSKKKGRVARVRDHWYKGSLRDLAVEVGKEDEYVWFCKRYNSSIHSGPFAIIHGPPTSEPRIVETLGVELVGRMAKFLVVNLKLDLSENTQEVLDACDVDILNLTKE